MNASPIATYLLPDGATASISATISITPPPPVPRAPVALGGYCYTPGQQSAAAWTNTLGRTPALINWYQDLVHSPAGFDAARATEVVNAGAVYHLSWELDDYKAGALQPIYSCDSFTGGEHDKLLSTWLAQMLAWGHTEKLVIRPHWEMTGHLWGTNDGYPWAVGTNGNSPGKFIDSWRHNVSLMRSIIPKARVVWCPSVEIQGGGLAPLEDCYPGDAWVDVVSMDGYNKGPQNPGGTWLSFQQVFEPTYTRLRQLAPTKPIIISETGCNNVGGDKAAWYTGIADGLAAMPKIAAVCLFTSVSGNQDYSLTDPKVAAAIKALAGLPVMQGAV